MTTTIFYSWQSDTNRELNQKFIQKALAKAVKSLRKNPEFIFNEPYVDRDTQGVAGSPNIVNTLTSKIESCNVFLGDLTIINSSSNKILRLINKHVLGREKPQPNANVMMEYGIAQANLGENCMMAVMNTAYGNPHNGNSEIIPFDVRQNSFPILYELKKRKDPNYDKKLEELSKVIESALKEIIRHNIKNPNFRYYPLLEFTHWRDEILQENIKFYSNTKIDSYKKQIKQEALKTNAVLRLNGLSGLGKTRLVFEAFDPKTFSDKTFQRIRYYNCVKEEIKFREVILKLSKSKDNSIIVLDNCNIALHNEISKIVRSTESKLSLITINPTIIESALDRAPDTIQIELTQEDYQTVIDEILADYFPGQSGEADKSRIASFASGHTFVAVALAKEVIRCRNTQEQWRPIINDTDLLDRLLGEDEINREILRAFATFTRFGFYQELEIHCQKIAQNHNLLRIPSVQTELRYQLVKDVCNKFLKKGIFEQQGRYLQIRIKPIAISLALQWWENTTTQNVTSVFESLDDPELKKNFCDQLRFLAFHPDAQGAVAQLCQGPFRQAEVLNTNEGSRLFRSLVEVNPLATIDALTHAFGSYSLEQLENISAGRRNLVWALEKLCFRQETFFKAAKLLLDFGAGENEHIANNASGQFVSLFQAYLPGTQATLTERIDFLDYAEQKQQSRYKQLYIGALIRSLESSRFMRMSGAEIQGSQQLKDYSPNAKEVFNYWKFAIDKLLSIAISESEFSDMAINGLFSHARGLVHIRLLAEIAPAIQKIVSIKPAAKISALRMLKNILRFESGNLVDDEKKQLRLLITDLEPQTFKERFETIIYSPLQEERNSEVSFDQYTVNARMFAEEFIRTDWKLVDFKIFFQSHSQEGIAFGERIGQEVVNTQQEMHFFSSSIEAIKQIELDKQNTSILAGFLRGVRSSGGNTSQYLKLFREDESLNQWVFYMTSASNASINDIMALFDLVNKNSNFLLGFKQLSVDHLPPAEIKEVIEKLLKYGKQGAWIALSQLYSYIFRSEEKWQSTKGILRTVLMNQDMLSSDNNTQVMDLYHWADSAIQILDKQADEELAQHLMNEIISACKTNSTLISLETYLHNLIRILIKDYFKVIWPALSSAILSSENDFFIYYNLKTLFGSRISHYSDNVGQLFYGDLNLIFDWCVNNKETAPSRIIGMAPIYTHFENEAEWYPFTKRLIDEFGNDQALLSELNSNLGSYSWTGSLIPLLRDQVKIMKKLIPHRFNEVENWASKNIEYLELQLASEKNEEEERFFN